MPAKQNGSGEKRCTYGKGHRAVLERFYKNGTKKDGLNGICSYHQGVVNTDNKHRRSSEKE